MGPQSWTAVPAALVYDSADPFAVRVRFGEEADGDLNVALDASFEGDLGGDAGLDEDAGVEWLLSRELLRAGLTAPVGDGDVRIWPARAALDVLYLQLRAPSGEALFELSAGLVDDFLRETERLVPAGTESDALHVDAELLALLHDGGSDNQSPH